jgi:uncharacterized membrane protein
MSLSEVHYLPLAPPFFFILVGLFVALLVLIQLGVLRYAYMRLGISSGAALLLLLASLIGSYFNIPVAYLPEQRVLAQQEIYFFGMRYVVPFVAQWPGTLIAVNVGGAVIPTMVSIYLLAKNRLWVKAALATAVVAAVCYWLSRPIPGLGIAEPVIAPFAVMAVGQYGARPQQGAVGPDDDKVNTPVAGADLLNLGNIRGLGTLRWLRSAELGPSTAFS